MMKVAFLSTFALDANVSLINALKVKCDIYFFTEALYQIHNFIDKDKLKNTISEGTQVEELKRFQSLIPLNKTYVIKGTRNSNIIKKLYISYKIHQYITKINPDVIILDNYMLTYFLSILRYRKKMMMVVHDPFLHSGENFLIDRYLRKIYFKLIDFKILLNESQRDDFIKHYNQDKTKIFTSFLSIYEYLACFKTGKKPDVAQFNVLFFGRISPYKGIKYLLDAFIILVKEKKYLDITLTIAGSGNFDFEIEEYKKYPQITILNNYIDPEVLADLINQSSVVVCPYTDATQSGVVMSSYAFKKPVIATNVGGLPEMVENKKTGLIIEPQSSQAIYEAIVELYNNKILLQEMSENIEKTYFSGEKSWNASAESFMVALSKIKE